MEQIIQTIKNIEKARTTLRQAITNNEIATSPKLKDLSYIQEIYNIFKTIKGNDININHRKEFIFAVVYLYCPNKLFGGKMTQGLRKAIVQASNVTCASVVSTTCTELLILYINYKDFRQGVDDLVCAVEERIRRKNINHT